MIDFISAAQNLPFTIAIAVMLMIALIEGVGAVLGASLSNVVDTLIPDVDLHMTGPDLEPTAFSRLLSWLRVGQVPVIVLIIIFLVMFGLSGLMIQGFVVSSFDLFLPAIFVSIPAFTFAIYMVRLCGAGLAKIIPQDETSVVSQDTFIGRIATITLGIAKSKSPAQAKVKDEHGKYHYVMVEPDTDTDSFEQGEELLLIRRNGSHFYAIRNNNLNLSRGEHESII